MSFRSRRLDLPTYDDLTKVAKLSGTLGEQLTKTILYLEQIANMVVDQERRLAMLERRDVSGMVGRPDQDLPTHHETAEERKARLAHGREQVRRVMDRLSDPNEPNVFGPDPGEDDRW